MRSGARVSAAAAGTPLPSFMTESVTDVIVSRSQRNERLTRMVMASAVAHALILAAVVLIPYGSSAPPVREVMTITLGGPDGPRNGGFTPLGGAPVQQVAPPEAPKPVETRAAPEKPKMTLPEPKPVKTSPATKAPAEAAAQKPTVGEKIVEGTTPVDTGVRGPGFGLSSAGGGAGGELQLDVKDFCCPEYIEAISASIKRNWRHDQGRPGVSLIRFTIRKDGRVEDVIVERSGGFYPLDAAAQRAVEATPLPQLPAAFPNNTLTVHMTFRYQ